MQRRGKERWRQDKGRRGDDRGDMERREEERRHEEERRRRIVLYVWQECV